MKKQNIISAILFGLGIGLSAITSAQSGTASINPVEKGTVTFSAGVGIGNEYNSNYYNSAQGTKEDI
jgi:hypothetical protein